MVMDSKVRDLSVIIDGRLRYVCLCIDGGVNNVCLIVDRMLVFLCHLFREDFGVLHSLMLFMAPVDYSEVGVMRNFVGGDVMFLFSHGCSGLFLLGISFCR